MRRPRPDRALGHALSALDRMHPEDRAIILDALEPAERAGIEDLVAELSGRAPRDRAPEDASPAYQGVSPWLRARLDPEAKPGRGSGEFFILTEATRKALEQAAEPFRVERADAPPGGCLLGWVWGRFTGAAR
jgi:hypothetical protein